jgi:lipid-binding SYLF domain-containing protein
VFAGATLNGAVIKQDSDDTRAFYGRVIPFKTLLSGSVTVPQEAQPFLGTLSKFATQAATPQGGK